MYFDFTGRIWFLRRRESLILTRMHECRLDVVLSLSSQILRFSSSARQHRPSVVSTAVAIVVILSHVDAAVIVYGLDRARIPSALSTVVHLSMFRLSLIAYHPILYYTLTLLCRLRAFIRQHRYHVPRRCHIRQCADIHSSQVLIAALSHSFGPVLQTTDRQKGWTGH